MNYEKEYFEQNYGVDNIADANIEYMKAEQEKIIEGNKLIAKAVGINNLKEDRPDLFARDIFTIGVWKHEYESAKGIWRSPLDREYAVTEKLEYHSSWDWLMPVVEKIEHIKGVTVIFSQTGCEILSFGKMISKSSLDTKIEAVWFAVVEFITWYNQTQIKWITRI